MRHLLLIILTVLSFAASAQVENKIPQYTFNGRLGVGRTGNNDTTAYLQVGPNGAAKKGVKLPMVTDTTQVAGLKTNGLTIFSVQLNQPVYWDSIIGRWRQMGGSLSHAPGTGDSLLFTAGNSLRLIASEFGVITTQYTNEVGFGVDTANIPTRYTIDSLGQIIVGNFPTAAIYEGLPGSPDSLTYWRNDSTLILRTPVPGDYLFSMAGTDTSWKWGVDTSQLFEDFREVSPNIYTGDDTLWSDRHVEINTRYLTIGTPFVQLYLQGQDYLAEPFVPQASLFTTYDTTHTQYASIKSAASVGVSNVELFTSNEGNVGEVDLNSSDISTVYQLNITSTSFTSINIAHTASPTDSKIENEFGINPSVYYFSNHSTASQRPDSTAKIFPFRPSAQGDTVLAHDLITGQLYRTLASGTGGGGSPVNIYNTSDTLEGNRVMNLEDYYLRISDGKDSVNADIWIGGSSNVFSITQRTQTTGYNGIYPDATWYNGIAASALSGDINKTIIYTGGGIVLQSGGSQNLGRDSLALPTISYSHKALVWDSTDGRIKQVVLPLAGGGGDTANLIIQNVGSGQQTWYESGDSLFMKRLKNATGVTWTTDTDSSILLSVDRIASVTTIGATPNVNGASVSGTVLNLQPASASFGGVVTTTTQTFAGSKTFNNDIVVNGITIGEAAGSVAGNTAVGASALDANTSAASNTAMGYFSLNELTGSGSSNNTAVGSTAGFKIQGTRNTGIGSGSLGGGSASSSSANDNTASGYRSLYTISDGDKNTFYGALAGDGVTTSSFNIGIGYNAMNSSNADSSLVIGNGAGPSLSGSGQLRIGHVMNGKPSIISGDMDSDTLRINAKLHVSTVDSSGTAQNMLYITQEGVIKKAAVPSGGGGVTSVSAGTGMSFTTITSTGAVAVDTAVMATRARVQKGIDSVAALIGSASGLTNIPMLKIAQALGNPVKYIALGLDNARITLSSTFNDGIATYVAVYIPESTTITGATWWQPVQGDYTADNENSISLYSYDGSGGLTEVATTGNDGNLWKGTANTWQTKAFTSTYAASPGVYFIAFLYNQSAVTTAPTMGSSPATANTLLSENGYTNSAKHIGTRTAQTTLPGTESMTNLARSGTHYAIGLY